MSSLPPGQHQWESTFGHDELGRPVLPRHHRLILAELAEHPTADAAQLLESRLALLEERFAYGPDGLLTTLGWGPPWWDEHTPHLGLIAVASKMSRWEDPVLETPHAIFHLASDHQDVLDAAGDVLFGGDGVDQHLKVRQVRTGFVGAGLPKQAMPQLDVPESAPLLLGFHSILRANQATEESITIPSGPLAGGTTQHVSRIELDVRCWHAKDRDEQAALLYAPTITAAEADRLADDAPSDYESYEQTVREHGIVGHGQAAAHARVDNVPVINRRDFATVDDGRPGTHFVSLQRELRDFNNTRAIMNAADGTGYHRSVGARRRNGINAFFDVTHRATFGIPPGPCAPTRTCTAKRHDRDPRRHTGRRPR